MSESAVGEIIDGLWRFEALLPEWTDEEGGEDGWEQSVSWWVIETPGGLVLVDPLADDWPALDRLLADRGGCAGIIRTCHWHQRSIPEAGKRYNAQVWARSDSGGRAHHGFDLAVTDGDQLFDAVVVVDVARADEIALWLPRQAVLLFGDVMIRTSAGQLRVCPESWTQPAGGPDHLRRLLAGLTNLPVQHVLVSHGPLVLNDGFVSLRAATA